MTGYGEVGLTIKCANPVKMLIPKPRVVAQAWIPALGWSEGPEFKACLGYSVSLIINEHIMEGYKTDVASGPWGVTLI